MVAARDAKMPPTVWLSRRGLAFSPTAQATSHRTDALPTRFNISRRGIDIQDMSCPICDNAIESTDHLFFRMEVLACFNSYEFQTQKDVRRSLVFHLVVRLDLSKQASI
ncbi:RNA-directed DNA polymerase, eukaryota [Tanacetum coccineum]